MKTLRPGARRIPAKGAFPPKKPERSSFRPGSSVRGTRTGRAQIQNEFNGEGSTGGRAGLSAVSKLSVDRIRFNSAAYSAECVGVGCRNATVDMALRSVS
ncbi:hypothetical protein TNIN_333861 [Trichonephila inaurata madagascariensis]|uniref:Uncharacterized protein n=1 Tax=Trichonephila inaurata madagascariensis TaxID=2747483 RepID=A0A8X6YDZ1_9ARAC|nr:hypothetical protein TNIN_333861 [Trichonephila inaurata madagascariensis]